MTNHRFLLFASAALLFLAPALHAQVSSSSGNAQPPVIHQVSAGQILQMLHTAPGQQLATIVQVDETAFQAGSGLITFSEFPTSTANPTYNPADYGGDASNPVVTFAGFFQGQALGTAADCPAGAALTGCVVGAATTPLTLDAASPTTFIQSDGANPTSPVLSGSPTFNGPIAILFDSDQAGVGLEGGFFDAIGGTAITAFARDGSVIGSVTNGQTGIEFLGLVTADGSNSIAGLLFSLVGDEPAGFAIDNLRFGTADVVDTPPGGGPAGPVTSVPVPALGGAATGLLLLLLAGFGLFAFVRR